MNKLKITILFLVFTLCSLQAQLTSRYNAPRSGDEIVKQQVDYKDPGRDGANVIWNFGQLRSVNDEYTLTYSSPILQADSFYVMGNDTIGVKETSSNSLIIGTEHNTMYYYQLKDEQLLLLGHENPTNLLYYTQPIVSAMYPTNYEQAYTHAYSSQGIYSGRTPFETWGNVSVEADAYGVIILPMGDTLNHVIRIKTVQSISEIIKSINPEMNQSLEMTIESYKWYSKGYRYPIFETIKAVNTTDTLNRQEYHSAFFFPPQEHLFLDNDKDNEAVLDSLWNIDHNKLIPTDKPEIDVKLTYNYYPNPVESQLTLDYYLESPATMKVMLYSLNGRLVNQLSLGKQDKGLHTEYIDCSSLTKGTYILNIIVNEQVIGNKLMKN